MLATPSKAQSYIDIQSCMIGCVLIQLINLLMIRKRVLLIL